MPFAFCTREKFPWCEFAESAEHGPTTKLIKEVYRDYHRAQTAPNINYVILW